jgi:hypothetical protein
LEEDREARDGDTALPAAMPMRLGVFCCAAPQPHWPLGPPLRDGAGNPTEGGSDEMGR